MNVSIVKLENEKIEWLLYKLRQLGWQGGTGLLLLVGAVLLLMVVILPTSSKLAKLNLELSQLKSTHSNLEQAANTKGQLDVAQKFYLHLPLQADANNKIAEILDAAKVAGLVSNKTEYMPQAVPTSAMIKYQIKMPVLGSYMQIRQFIKQVLNSHPSLALNAINLKRNDINNDAVEANIQMTLYLQKTKS